VQFQGMIARISNVRRSRAVPSWNATLAQQGGVKCAFRRCPDATWYVRKSDTSAAFYEVIEARLEYVRMVFEIYTQQGLSIKAIARLLNERQIATRTGRAAGERSTVWGMFAPRLSWNRMFMARTNYVPGNESRPLATHGKA